MESVQVDVLVIGGSASGMVAATTAKSFHPDKEVLLVRKERQVLVPCGIPYIFGSLESSEQNLMPYVTLEKLGVRTRIDEVVSIDTENKVCGTADGSEIAFDKLVLAVGSSPAVPRWLKGVDLENVFSVPKDKEYLDGIMENLKDCGNLVVVGGGFIGVELADELNKLGKKVTIVEMLPRILDMAFDEEFAIRAAEILESRGVEIRTGEGIKKIVGDGRARGVLLNDGDELPSDIVFLAIGYRPNTQLVERSGIELNKMGFIRVNEYMRTDHPDIYAIGDCAEKKGFITRTRRSIMLASTACAEARIAAVNLYKLSTVRSFGGTIAIYSTVIGDTAFGVAGVTERMARDRGFNVVTGVFEGLDRHPGTLPGARKQIVKWIVARESGVLIGGQVMGGASTGELTNLIGLAIQNRMTVNSILTAQVGTHPLLTGSPTAYPLIKAAEVVARSQWVQ